MVYIAVGLGLYMHASCPLGKRGWEPIRTRLLTVCYDPVVTLSPPPGSLGLYCGEEMG